MNWSQLSLRKLARVSNPFTNCNRYAVERLKDQATRHVFRIELRNRFEALDEDSGAEEIWVNMKEAEFGEQANEEVLGHRKNTANPWPSREP